MENENLLWWENYKLGNDISAFVYDGDDLVEETIKKGNTVCCVAKCKRSDEFVVILAGSSRTMFARKKEIIAAIKR